LVAVSTVALAFSVLPFLHAHAGVTWSLTGGHAHPPVIHSVFASDEASHPLAEPQRPAFGEARATAPHDLGHEIESVSGTTTTPMVLEVGKVGVLQTVSATREQVPAEVPPPTGVIEASAAPRAPPFCPIS
jgi:hypothetical protein